MSARGTTCHKHQCRIRAVLLAAFAHPPLAGQAIDQRASLFVLPATDEPATVQVDQRGTARIMGPVSVEIEKVLHVDHWASLELSPGNDREANRRQDRQTEGQLQFIIDTLAKTHVPDIEFDVYKCELLVGDFLYTPPSERLRPKPQMLTKRTRVGGLVMSSRQVASNRRTKIGNRYGVFGELFSSAGGPRQKTLPRQGGYTTTESRTASDSKRCATGEE